MTHKTVFRHCQTSPWGLGEQSGQAPRAGWLQLFSEQLWTGAREAISLTASCIGNIVLLILQTLLLCLELRSLVNFDCSVSISLYIRPSLHSLPDVWKMCRPLQPLAICPNSSDPGSRGHREGSCSCHCMGSTGACSPGRDTAQGMLARSLPSPSRLGILPSASHFV